MHLTILFTLHSIEKEEHEVSLQKHYLSLALSLHHICVCTVCNTTNHQWLQHESSACICPYPLFFFLLLKKTSIASNVLTWVQNEYLIKNRCFILSPVLSFVLLKTGVSFYICPHNNIQVCMSFIYYIWMQILRLFCHTKMLCFI